MKQKLLLIREVFYLGEGGKAMQPPSLPNANGMKKSAALTGRTDGFERSMQEADSVFEECLNQEQKGDSAAALALCNEALCK